MAKPIAMLAASLLVLALGIAALWLDPYAIIFHTVQAQSALWQRFGAQQLARPGWALTVESLFVVASCAAMLILMARTRLRWAGLFLLGALLVGTTRLRRRS